MIMGGSGSAMDMNNRIRDNRRLMLIIAIKAGGNLTLVASHTNRKGKS